MTSMAITGVGAQGRPCVHGVPLGRDQKCRECAWTLAEVDEWRAVRQNGAGTEEASDAHAEARERAREAGLEWVGVRR